MFAAGANDNGHESEFHLTSSNQHLDLCYTCNFVISPWSSGRACPSCSFFVVHHQLVPQDQTTNAEFYATVLRCLREELWHKPPELWCNGNWMPSNDNAPAHTMFLQVSFLATPTQSSLYQAYFLDSAPSYVFLFPKMKF